MNLKCNIKGKEYDLVQGVTLTEEYNETLDSASIIVDGIEKIEDLQPYDDVFIYEGTFNGYSNRDTAIRSFYFLNTSNYVEFNAQEIEEIFKTNKSKIVSQSIDANYQDNTVSVFSTATNVQLSYDESTQLYYISYGSIPRKKVQLISVGDKLRFEFGDYFSAFIMKSAFITMTSEAVVTPTFYKHFLVYQFSEERLNPVGNAYKYVIELCSETKKLETIQLPNVSITQPLDVASRRSVYDYIEQYLNLYNPTIKVATSENTWGYQGKYTLDTTLKDIYGKTYCPDFSLDNPSLRDVYAQLFLTKDRIPYVKDDKIYALDITARTGDFSTDNVTSIKGSRSYENHADNLKRTYSNALSGRNTCKRLEYLGFRNNSNALMTLSNMQIETQFPIYKINKIYMCYYKKAHIYKDVTDSDGVTTATKVGDKVFLCKQDITPLVKLEQERQVLSQDWNNFNDDPPSGSNCIEEMAKYKLCTVGYSIGGTTISGWGTQYKYPKGWWDITVSYIENIFKIIDRNIPFGIYTYGYVASNLGEGEYIFLDAKENPLDNLVTPFSGSSRLKSFFFTIDYEGFYNGTILTSKDVSRDDIVINDNSSSSLTLLEKDGLFQKEKANRFGNMAYTIEAIYNDVSEVQELGSVYDDDVIIYHREYSIFNRYVKALYYGTKDYVLKNYYTSVYAKHRPFALMDYSESIKRAENRKMYILIAKNKLYYEDNVKGQTLPISFTGFSPFYLSNLMSFYKPTPLAQSIDRLNFDNKINYGFIEYGAYKYASDVNTFVSGYSLCFNLAMTDNISAGNYIKIPSPDINATILQPTDDDYTGSIQDFYPIVDSTSTGFTATMGFYVCHVNQNTNFNDVVFDYKSGIENTLYNNIFNLPKLPTIVSATNLIGSTSYICKDNKEVIDMTYQIEPYTNDEDVLFSEWLMKLSDLNGVYNKVAEDYTVEDIEGAQLKADIYYGTAVNYTSGSSGGINYLMPVFILKIATTTFANLAVGTRVNAIHSWSSSQFGSNTSNWFRDVNISYTVNMQEIVSVASDKIGIKCYVQTTIRHGLWGGQSESASTVVLYLSKFTTLGDLNVASDTANYYFTDIEITKLTYSIISLINGCNATTGFFSDGHTYVSTISNLDDGKLLKDSFLISKVGGATKTYTKNMFIRQNTEAMKKTLIYNDYKENEITFTNLKITNVITEVLYDTSKATKITHSLASIIRVDLSAFSRNAKAIEFWYKEEIENSTPIYHFVFGVNVTTRDFVRGYVDIYLSSISKKDTRVFGANHLEVGEALNYREGGQKYGERQYYVVK